MGVFQLIPFHLVNVDFKLSYAIFDSTNILISDIPVGFSYSQCKLTFIIYVILIDDINPVFHITILTFTSPCLFYIYSLSFLHQ
jgi:hypothetical protein